METWISLSQACSMPDLLPRLHSPFLLHQCWDYPVMWQAGLLRAAANFAPWSSSLCKYGSNSMGVKLEVSWSILQLWFQKEVVLGWSQQVSEVTLQLPFSDYCRKIWRDGSFVTTLFFFFTQKHSVLFLRTTFPVIPCILYTSLLSHTQKTQTHIHTAQLKTSGLQPIYFKTSILHTGQCHLSDEFGLD